MLDLTEFRKWRESELQPLILSLPDHRQEVLTRWFDETDRLFEARAHEQQLAGKLRNGIIGLAMDGLVSPARAEALASEFGLTPLASVPDPTRFNPDRELSWSLPMAVAWVSTRSIDAVRQQWDKYRDECWEWSPGHWRFAHPTQTSVYAVDGWELICIGNLERWDIPDAEDAALSLADAQRALWSSLIKGTVAATGYTEDGTFGPIPAFEWHQLDAPEKMRRIGGVERRAQGGVMAFNRVTISRDDLVAAFPSHEEVATVADSELPGETLHPEPVTARRRGAKKGQGAIDDSASISRVLELERTGVERYDATLEIAHSLSDGTQRSFEAHRRRLLRKLASVPALVKSELAETK